MGSESWPFSRTALHAIVSYRSLSASVPAANAKRARSPTRSSSKASSPRARQCVPPAHGSLQSLARHSSQQLLPPEASACDLRHTEQRSAGPGPKEPPVYCYCPSFRGMELIQEVPQVTFNNVQLAETCSSHRSLQ